MLLQLQLFSDTNSVKHEIIEGELEWESGEKPSNPMEIEEQNRKTNKNLLAL